MSPMYVFRNPTLVIVQNYQDALGVRRKEMLAVIFLVASIKKMVRLATKSCIVIRLPVHVKTLVTQPMRSTVVLVREGTKFVEPVKIVQKDSKENLANALLSSIVKRNLEK